MYFKNITLQSNNNQINFNSILFLLGPIAVARAHINYTGNRSTRADLKYFIIGDMYTALIPCHS